jgi:hypothetical protein
MQIRIILFVGVLAAASVWAATDTFDKLKPGAITSPWSAGVTGKGEVACEVVAEKDAPSKPHVLKQSKEGTFPYCVRKDVSLSDGSVEVRFKSISGSEDQAAGLMWRFKDGDNYYVARANALEDNVSLYYTEGGKRKTLKYVDAPVGKDKWHLLRIDFAGKRIKVSLDQKAYIELDDDHIQGPGAVGVWTKADSVTEFDDFTYSGTESKKGSSK